jgi:hypothetical protein
MDNKLKKYQNIPDDNHVARHCSDQRLLFDENDQPYGVSPAHFELKGHIKETYLSCNWYENYGEDQRERLKKIGVFWRKFDWGKSGRAIISNVSKIKKTGQKFGIIISVKTVGTKAKADPGYSGIYNLPLDNSNGDLLAALAEETVDGIINHNSEDILE